LIGGTNYKKGSHGGSICNCIASIVAKGVELAI